MRWAVSLVAVLLLTSVVARAETLNIDAAKNHFGAGKAYYDERRWEDALREFKEAYRLSKKPALLFNIALCNERLLRYDEALEVLRNYLRIDPNAEDRPGIERKIGELEAAIKATKPGERPPPLPSTEPDTGPPVSTPKLPPEVGTTPPAVTPPASLKSAPPAKTAPRKRVYTWVVGAAGVALLAAGAGTAVGSHLDYQTLADQCGPTRNGCPAGWEQTRDRGQHLAWAADGLLAAGGVAVVTAAVLYFFEGRTVEKPRVTLSPLFTTRGAGAGLSGSIEF